MRKEVAINLPGPSQQCVWVDITRVNNGQHILVDVVVATPLCPDIVGTTSWQVEAAATHATAVKE